MNLSVVIPLLNEEASLVELHQRIVAVAKENQYSYEIIFIDDGSTDNSWNVIESLHQKDTNVKAIRFRKNYGKSQALNAGFQMARGEVVVTMDADLQDFPEEIPELMHKILHKEYDLVSGWKQKRKDPILTKNIPSKLFNWIARKTSGLNLHDFNCGLKAYHHELAKSLHLMSDMHRYTPVLAKNLGFTRITEQKVKHAARKHGTSKFGASRFVNGFLDLITLWFIGRFANRPMHFFGALGTLMFVVGFFSAAFIGGFKLYQLSQGISVRLVTDNPWFYISLVAMVLGTQLFLAGFLGEILARTRKKHQAYEVKETL